MVNTSLGFGCNNAELAEQLCNLEHANQQAVTWIEKVRGTDSLFAPNIEGRFIHVDPAGNVPSSAPDVTDTTINDQWAAAAMLEGLEEAGVLGSTPIPNLTNTLVVENAALSTTAFPYEPARLNESSKFKGHVGGIGTSLWSYRDRASEAGFKTGTSMAAPQVAGLAAYLWNIKPALTPQEVIQILVSTGRADRDLSAAHPDCNITQFSAPIIDAYAAVLALDEPSALTGGGVGRYILWCSLVRSRD